MIETTPLIVWDCREDRWWENDVARRAWLHAHGLPVGTMYRTEFWLADAPFARVFCYVPGERGTPYWLPCHVQVPHDHLACSAAREKPRDIVLESLPPEVLW